MKNEQKTKKSPQKSPISPVLKSLDLFKTVTYPISRLSSVRTTIQIIQAQHKMFYTTRKNKETKQLEVTRIK